jgi:hypothetical protein
MSHKLPGPPIGPFGATVYVDKDSTSAIEDGSTAHPYKTIQAALDAKPDPAPDLLAENLFWGVVINAGLYDEDLTIPPKGRIALLCHSGLVYLATAALGPRNITWNPVIGDFGTDGLLHTQFINTVGNLTVTAGAGVKAEVLLRESEVSGNIVITSDPSSAELSLENASVGGAVTVANGTVSGIRSNLNGNLSCGGLERWWDGGLQAVTVTGDTGTLRDADVQGNASFGNGMDKVVRCGFGGDLTVSSGHVNLMEDTDVGSNLTLQTFTILRGGYMTGAAGFNGTGKVRDTHFESLVTKTADAVFFHGCRFNNGLTTAGNNDRFYNCDFPSGTTFTGVAGSYAVDANTHGKSDPTLAGGATRVMLGNPDISASGVPSLPYTLDNTTLNYARMSVNATDTGWYGTAYILIEDGVNTQYVAVVNFGGSNPTATQYDSGGGLGWHAGLFSQVFAANLAAATLDIQPHWSQLSFFFNTMWFRTEMTVGDDLYLAHTGLTHDLIGVRAIGAVDIESGCSAGDTVTIGVNVFTAVNPGPANPAAQEFLDVAAAGSDFGCAASLATAINDPASQASLIFNLGFAVTAEVNPAQPDVVMLDSGGNHFALNTGSTNIFVYQWNDISTAIVLTPGSDMS